MKKSSHLFIEVAFLLEKNMSTIALALPNPPANFSTTLNGGISSTDISITLNSVSGLGTEGVGVIYQKDSNGEPIASTIEFIHWTGISTNTLTLTDTGDRGVSGSASGAQAHSNGDTFEVWIHPEYHFKDWATVEHSAAGTHDNTKIPAVAGSNATTLTTTGTTNVTLPTTGTLSTLAGAETLTNKTLTSPKVGTAILDTNGNELLKVTATGSAVNEVTLVNAATGNAPSAQATGDDTNINLDLRGKGTGTVLQSMRWQNDTTDSTEVGVKKQVGWGFLVGTGASSASESVTFPTAFSTKVLAVMVTPLGFKDSSDPSGIGDFGNFGLSCLANSITTSGFTVVVNALSGTYASTRRVGYCWEAYGI